MWCDTFVVRSWVLAGLAIGIGSISLRFAIFRIVDSVGRGCPEFSACACKRFKDPSASPRTRGQQVQLVGFTGSSSTSAANDDSPRMPPLEPTRLELGKTILNVSWSSNLMLATRMVFVVLIGLEPQMGLMSGQRLVLTLTLASEILAMDAVVREQQYQRTSADLPLPLVYLMMATIAGCMVITILAFGAFGTAYLDDVWGLHVAIAIVVAMVSVVIGILFVSRTARVPAAVTGAMMQKTASALILLLATATSAATIYGSVLPRDEREVTAAAQGCYGSLTASTTDVDIFFGSVGLLADGVLFLILSTPRVRCTSAETRPPNRYSNM